MHPIFQFLAGVGIMVFLIYAGMGLYNYLSNNNKTN